MSCNHEVIYSRIGEVAWGSCSLGELLLMGTPKRGSRSQLLTFNSLLTIERKPRLASVHRQDYNNDDRNKEVNAGRPSTSQ